MLRAMTMVGWFMRRAMTVARPDRVRPCTRVPSACQANMTRPSLCAGIEEEHQASAHRISVPSTSALV
jgi:hypothetical protein